MPLVMMGKFTAAGMRAKLPDGAFVCNTCSDNDTASPGAGRNWSWSNPTSRAIPHRHGGVEAVSVECLWQGTKVYSEGGRPDPATLGGDWRRGKARRPIGAWDGDGRPLIRTPGEARRRIYIPAFRRLVEHWLRDPSVLARVEEARRSPGPVFLRDHDTGRGIDRNGPMSHAWVLAMFLNAGDWDFAAEAP